MATPKYDSTIAYQSVSPEKPGFELGNHPQIAQKRKWISTIILQVASLLWLVPIIALLYLNFTGYVIGASAWCPDGTCWAGLFNPVSAVVQRKLYSLDDSSHDLLGALQFVAKALEVWFVFVAAALVYLITMSFAGRTGGLPIGYLTRPIEFADAATLIDPLLWQTGPSPFGSTNPIKKRVGMRVWFLIGFSVFLCVLCNLIGPATAVLVIPTLQWIDTENYGVRQFAYVNSASPPAADGGYSWIWWRTANCYEKEFREQTYSCMEYPFGRQLDSWFASYLGSTDINDGPTIAGVTQQDGLTFASNNTKDTDAKSAVDLYYEGYHDVLWWAPSRQIVSNISTDLRIVRGISNGATAQEVQEWSKDYSYYPDPYETYTEYNKSLELDLRRNGPVLGSAINMWVTRNDRNFWTVSVDKDRQIRCYFYYNLFQTPLFQGSSQGHYTKCIRTGSGWSDLNKKASFSVKGVRDPTLNVTSGSIDVTVFSSDRAVFFPNQTYPSWLPKACLGYGDKLNGTVCDWDRIFTTNPDDPVYNRTQNVNTIEYKFKDSNSTTTLAVDFTAYLAFTQYSIDPSPVTNPQLLAQTLALPRYGKNVAIDPAWVLASWAVDAGGQLQGNRASTAQLVSVMQELSTRGRMTGSNNLWHGDDQSYYRDYVALIPVLHTLSMVDHSTDFVDDPTAVADKDAERPLLTRHARIYVWAFGVSSRTSWLGAIVCIIGCLVVVAQVILGFTDRRRYRSPTQLLVAALEHAPRGEFEGKAHDEKAMARVRFHIKDDDNQTGKYSFYEPDLSDSAQHGHVQERKPWTATA